MEDFIVARYLSDRRADGRYVPKVSIRWLGRPEIVITDPEGRTYRDLNRALEMDFWLLNRWKAKHAPYLQLVIES
jgi:hypothetical protein